MTRRRHASLVVLLSVAAFTASAAVTGCADNPVGRICDLGASVPQADEAVVASPSLDCVSRTCLRVPLGRELPPGSSYPTGTSGLCTAECSADSDCDRVPESPCITGFTCGIPDRIAVSDFCCRKFCICKDYIVIPESGHLDVPKGCDPAIPDNACCNLAGRQNSSDPRYSACKP